MPRAAAPSTEGPKLTKVGGIQAERLATASEPVAAAAVAPEPRFTG